MRAVVIAAAMALSLAACKGDQQASANLGAAQTFMADNAKKPDVKTLPSGVQYAVVRSGPADGPHPGPRSTVKVHYEGKLVSGEVFDSSYERGVPAVMRVDRLIPAWTEALQQMRPGDEWMLYVPPEQGYGAEGGGPIPPNSVLIFRIELLGVA